MLRNGNRIYITEPLGFDFDDGRLVLTLRQAFEMHDLLSGNSAWIFETVEEEPEDG